MGRKFLLVFLCAVWCFSFSAADVFVRESFPVGNGGYSASSLFNQRPAESGDSFGFVSQWYESTGVYQISADGLQYPVSSQLTASGGSVYVNNGGSSDATGRNNMRLIDTDMFPQSGRLYFSCLFKYDGEKAVQSLKPGQGYGIGLSPVKYPGKSSTDSLCSQINTSGLFFALYKSESGNVDLVLRVNGQNYPLIENPAAGTTFFCIARIDLNCVEDGMEIVRGSAVPAEEWSGEETYETCIVADLISENSNFLEYLCLSGAYATGNSPVYWDEVLVTDTYEEAAGGVGNPGPQVYMREPVDPVYHSATLIADIYDMGQTGNFDLYLSYAAEGDAPSRVFVGYIGGTGTVSHAVSNLDHTKVYTFEFEADVAGETYQSVNTRSFQTSMSPVFEDFSCVGSISSGVQMNAFLKSAGASSTTVEACFGDSLENMKPVKTWENAESGEYAALIPAEDLAFGVTYYAKFRAFCSLDGQTYENTTETVQIVPDQIFDWTGAGQSTDWHDSGNWNLLYVPDYELANVLLTGSNTVITSASAVTLQSMGIEGASSGGMPAELSFQGTLNIIENLTLGTNTTTTANFNGGTYSVGGTVEIGTYAKNSVISMSDASVTAEQMLVGTKNSGSSNKFEMSGNSVLNLSALKIGGGSSANVVTLKPGSVLNITGDGVSGISTTDAGNGLIIDGATVNNDGLLENAIRSSNNTATSSFVEMRNGAILNQNGEMRVSSWYNGKVYVLDGSQLRAQRITVGTASDSGANSALIVSNSLLTASSIAIPGDDRHRNASLIVYEDEGSETSVEIEGNFTLAVYDSRRTGNQLNSSNLLSVNGGTVTIGGDLFVGGKNVEAHSNNTVRVSGKSSRINVENLTAVQKSRFVFDVPAGGFSAVPVSVNGTASLAEDSVLEINASEFVKAGGGTTVLISAGVLADDSFSPQNISVDTGELRFAAEVLQENGKVTFKASPLNTVLIIR